MLIKEIEAVELMATFHIRKIGELNLDVHVTTDGQTQTLELTLQQFRVLSELLAKHFNV
jgi:hypothetical protein